jgi:NaMN:DMB phosphoribosyltransferase
VLHGAICTSGNCATAAAAAAAAAELCSLQTAPPSSTAEEKHRRITRSLRYKSMPAFDMQQSRELRAPAPGLYLTATAANY